MIKIAFCDDDQSVLNDIGLLLEEYQREKKREISCEEFNNPFDLLERVDRGAHFDVIFLDVLMPGENGMETAHEIRSRDNDVKIIFMTTSPEYAVESYQVNAFFYQMKPVSREIFFRLMDSVLSSVDKEAENGMILRCKNGIARVELKKLEYCEVSHRTLFIHMSDGTVLESIGSMEELCRQLEKNNAFLRTHRSYLINLDHVRNISFRAVTMACGAEIPIPRGKYTEIKNTFLSHAFENEQVML